MIRCIIILILIKCYVKLIVDLILLLIIEDVVCCLRELCFDARKPIIWIVRIVVFLDRELMVEENVLGCVSKWNSK
jgi:hypothetical protein